MAARSLPDQVRGALRTVRDDAETRNVRLARMIDAVVDTIDDAAALKLRALLR